MLEMRRLRLLRELKLRGTIGAVADALSFSPSSVSQQLAQLEREAAAAKRAVVRRARRMIMTVAEVDCVFPNMGPRGSLHPAINHTRVWLPSMRHRRQLSMTRRRRTAERVQLPGRSRS